jgi:uncharacterized protein (DUF488 family)
VRTRIWTIGHGNRPGEEFLALLKAAEIECLVDVRAYPASRRHPHFAREALEKALAAAGIGYIWEGAALGGRRRPEKNSPNTALRSAAFRAYADHMLTEEFRQGVNRLSETGHERHTAVMCAERLPWQCHRFLISDYLTARSVRVIHLVNPGREQEHRLSDIARIRAGVLVYDGETQLDLGDM